MTPGELWVLLIISKEESVLLEDDVFGAVDIVPNVCWNDGELLIGATDCGNGFGNGVGNGV